MAQQSSIPVLHTSLLKEFGPQYSNDDIASFVCLDAYRKTRQKEPFSTTVDARTISELQRNDHENNGNFVTRFSYFIKDVIMENLSFLGTDVTLNSIKVADKYCDNSVFVLNGYYYKDESDTQVVKRLRIALDNYSRQFNADDKIQKVEDAFNKLSDVEKEAFLNKIQ